MFDQSVELEFPGLVGDLNLKETRPGSQENDSECNSHNQLEVTFVSLTMLFVSLDWQLSIRHCVFDIFIYVPFSGPHFNALKVKTLCLI